MQYHDALAAAEPAGGRSDPANRTVCMRGSLCPRPRTPPKIGDYVPRDGRLTGQRTVVVDNELVPAGDVGNQGVRLAVAGVER